MRHLQSHRRLVPVSVIAMLVCSGAAARFHEGWETARVGFYSLDEGIEESLIQADEGTWLADSAVGAEGEELGEGEPGCGPNPHAVEIDQVAGDKALRLTSGYSDGGCADNVWVSLADFSRYGELKLNRGFKIPLRSDTSIYFEASGELFDPQMHGWGPLYDKISLSIVDMRGNVLVYVLQHFEGAEPITGSSYREVFLDPNAGFYQRNLFDDFSSIQDFRAQGANIGDIVFEVDEHGWAIIDNIVIGPPRDMPEPPSVGAEFFGLGPLPGSDWCIATALSADGQVVIGHDEVKGLPVYWNRSAGMSPLPLDIGEHLAATRAYALSSDGSVVVGTCPSVVFDFQSKSEQDAFAWSQVDGIIGLGYPSGVDGLLACARGVSGDGCYVVGRYSDVDGQTRAFGWTGAAGMLDLGRLSGGLAGSEATAVSGDGQVVVGWSSSAAAAGGDASQGEAFRWTQAEGMVGLGFLPGRADSTASALCTDGTVIVGASATGETAGHGNCYEAFRWSRLQGMTGLGSLEGYVDSRACAVSADGGIVVGLCSTADYEFSMDHVAGDSQAFIWDRKYGLQNLKDVLARGYHAHVAGWQLIDAVGVSADGTTIVGNGVNPDGLVEPWMAVITAGQVSLGLEIVNARIPEKVVSGDGTRILLPVSVTNLGAEVLPKEETIDFILKARPVTGGPDVRLMVLPDRPIGNLKPGCVKKINAVLYVPPGVATDDYLLVVQVGTVEATTPVDQPMTIEYGHVALVSEFTKNTLPSAVLAGSDITGAVSVRITNQGNVAVAKNTTVRVRVLLQNQQSALQYELEAIDSFTIGGLGAGKSKVANVRVSKTPEVPEGTYDLVAVVESEDRSLSVPPVVGDEIAISQPFVDLQAEVHNAEVPAEVEAGSSAEVILPLTITNQGNDSLARGQTIDVSVSLQKVGDSEILPVKTLSDQSVSSLAPGKSKVIRITATVPPTVPEGSYHILVTVDSSQQVSESDENNNTADGGAISVVPAAPDPIGLADLTVLDMDLPATIQSGEFLRIETTIKNVGSGASCTTDLVFYLSTNALFGDDDYYLSSGYVPPIAPGQSASVSTRLLIPPVAFHNIRLYIIAVVNPYDTCQEGGRGSRNNAHAESAKFAAIGQ